MSQYYYTIASLPFLLYNHKPGVTVAEFEETCREQLVEKDFSELISLRLSSPETATGKDNLLKVWKNWEISMRNELVNLRAKERNQDPASFRRDTAGNFDATIAAGEAFSEDYPLRSEEILDRARWRFLDSLEVGHHFDLCRLMIYYLKLQMVERKFSFKEDEGKEKFKNIMNVFNNSINSWESSNGKQ